MKKQPSSVKLCTCVIQHSDAPMFDCRNKKKNTFLTTGRRFFFFFHHILWRLDPLIVTLPTSDSLFFIIFLPVFLLSVTIGSVLGVKKTLLASNKTLNEIQERGSIDCIWLQSHFNPSPLHVRALDWRELQAEGGRGADALVFSRGPCALLTCLDSSVAAVIRSALTGKQGVCGRTWS